jgi:hypothetical protein
MSDFLILIIYVSCRCYSIHISASIPYLLSLPHNLAAEDRILNPRKTQLNLGGDIPELVNRRTFNKQNQSVLAYAIQNLQVAAYDG